jgi:hypothetical protein
MSPAKIPRDLHEDARDVARALPATPQYAEACRRRKKIEMLFADEVRCTEQRVGIQVRIVREQTAAACSVRISVTPVTSVTPNSEERGR